MRRYWHSCAELTRRCGRALTIAAVLLAPAAVGARELVDRVAAVIENEIITLRELENKAAPFMEQLDEIESPQAREKKRREILRQVLDIEIGEKIVSSELEKNRDKLGVTDKDIDNAIELVMQTNNLTRERLQAALYGQGMTWSEYRRQLREQIARARLIQFKVQGKVQITDAEAKQRCQERQTAGGSEMVCASHILLKVEEGDDVAMIKARASKLQAELANGADFAAYALKHSDDKAAPDGSLGCFGRGEMVQEFENAAFSTEVGKVSPVVQTDFGFHVLKVHERKAAAGACDSEESLAPFKNEVYQEKMEQQMNIWIDELRKDAFVEVRI